MNKGEKQMEHLPLNPPCFAGGAKGIIPPSSKGKKKRSQEGLEAKISLTR